MNELIINLLGHQFINVTWWLDFNREKPLFGLLVFGLVEFGLVNFGLIKFGQVNFGLGVCTGTFRISFVGSPICVAWSLSTHCYYTFNSHIILKAPWSCSWIRTLILAYIKWDQLYCASGFCCMILILPLLLYFSSKFAFTRNLKQYFEIVPKGLLPWRVHGNALHNSRPPLGRCA